MKVHPIVECETADEWMEGKPQSTEEVVEENYPLVRFRGRNDLPAAGSRCAILTAKYPAPRIFLMCRSVMEEAIHLPPAPDMIGEGRGEGCGLGRWSSSAQEWMSKEEEGEGRKGETLSLYKG